MIRRPFHPAYHPWAWRNWLDFGTGLLGDLGLRTLSTVFKALKLRPSRQRGSERDEAQLGEIYPRGEIVRFEFPACGSLSPVTLTWYDGGLKPARPAELADADPMLDIIYADDQGKFMATGSSWSRG